MAVSSTDVQKAYLAYFGRPADPVGLDYWMTQDATTMKAGFAASTEYAALYSGMDSSQRIEQVYQNLFGRSSDPVGKDYWINEFDSGRQSVSSLVDIMLRSALGVDITTISYHRPSRWYEDAPSKGALKPAGPLLLSRLRTCLDQRQLLYP